MIHLALDRKEELIITKVFESDYSFLLVFAV
jgi:hypothetical protein